MNRWLNRFASLCCVTLAACQSAPHEDAIHARETAGAAATSNGAAGAVAATSATAQAAPAAPVSGPAAQQYADALRAMRAGQSSEAEARFKRLAADYPDLAGPEVNLGLVYLQGNRLLDAEAAFKNAVSRNPANAAADNALGIVERKLGKFSDAEVAYQRAIAAQPDYAPAYLNLGVLYDLYLAEPQKALEQFEHYTQLVGDNKQVNGWMIELRKRVGAPAVKKEPA